MITAKTRKYIFEEVLPSEKEDSRQAAIKNMFKKIELIEGRVNDFNRFRIPASWALRQINIM